MESDLRPDDAADLYRAMYRARRFDEVAIALQRQGALGGYGSARGQEAAQIGSVIDLSPSDMVFPSYRQPGVGLLRGATPREVLFFYARQALCPWDWRGLRFGPYTIPVGSQLAHATGWALADRARGSDAVTLVFFGDGSASQGEVHEAMNMAGVTDAPIVFVCENNGWAISLPFAEQTRAPSIAARAQGYGIAGEQVDGNDVLAVREVVRRAVVRARAGLGPTLIEAVTYRVGGHTTADDPSLYRASAEPERWAHLDPIDRFAGAGESAGWLEVEVTAGIRSEVDAEMDEVAAALVQELGGSR